MRNKDGLIKIASGIIIFVSIATIIGWVMDVEILKTALPGLPSMKMNTAICIVLCGVVALFCVDDVQKHFNIIIPLNLIVLILSALTLFEYIFKVNLRIDEFLVEESTAISTPGRMAVTSASCLVLLSTGFALVTAQAPKMFGVLAQLFFFLVALVAFLAITGYILNIPDLHNLSLSKSMALLTALLLLPLSLVYAALLKGHRTGN
nr:hypothetical protein [uncultured Mucilaginibacter sp.]